MLTELRDNIAKTIRFLGRDVLDQFTSVPHRVEKSINAMWDDSIDRIINNLFGGIMNYARAYKSTDLGPQTSFVDALKVTYNTLSDYAMWHQMTEKGKQATRNQITKSMLTHLPNAKLAFALYLHHTEFRYSQYTPLNRYANFRFDCNEYIASTMSNLQTILSSLFIQDDTQVNPTEFNNPNRNLRRIIVGFPKQVDEVRMCLEHYERYLDQTVEFLRSLWPKNATFATRLTKEEELMTLTADLDIVTNIIEGIVEGRLSVFDANAEINSDGFKNIEHHLQEITSSASDNILQPLRSYIEKTAEDLIDVYIEGINRVEQLEAFFEEESKDPALISSDRAFTVRKLFIWMKPIPNLYSEVVSYLYNLYRFIDFVYCVFYFENESHTIE